MSAKSCILPFATFRHLFFYADQDGRNYSHVHTQLITPVKCGTTGVEVYGCFCKDPEANVEKVVSSPLKHKYVPTFEWTVEMEENAPAIAKKECIAHVTCENCGDTYDRGTTVTEKVAKKATCTENGEILLTAKVVIDGKTYTEEKTVTVTASHTVKYNYAKGDEMDSNGQIPNFQQSSSFTEKDETQYHMAVCSQCGTYLSNWEKHTFSEFTQNKDDSGEYTNTFSAACVCGNKWTSYTGQEFSLEDALIKANTKGWEVSVVRISDPSKIDEISDDKITVPSNVTLIVEEPFEVDDKLTIEVKKGGHVTGELGDNVIVKEEGSKDIEATVTTEDALTEVFIDLEKDANVTITLDKDVSVTTPIEIKDVEKANVTIDLNNKELKGSSTDLLLRISAENDTEKNVNVIVKNGELSGSRATDDKCLVAVNSGKLTLDNVEVTTTKGYGVAVFGDGNLEVVGGSINATDAPCVSTNHAETDEDGEIILTDVEMVSENSVAVYIPSATKVKINNCDITGKRTLEVASGDLTVTNSRLNYLALLPTSVTVKTDGPFDELGGALLIRLQSAYIKSNEKITVSIDSNTTLRYTNSNGDTLTDTGARIGVYQGDSLTTAKNLVLNGYNVNLRNEVADVVASN